jgi:hypothetical protein
MKTFLIIAERPQTDSEDNDVITWRTFLAAAGKAVPPSKNATRLTEGLWQMTLDGGLHSLVTLLQLAKPHGIAIRLALLDEPPVWIKYS